MYYKGLEIKESKYMTKGYSNEPVRRHKKKRIQKKWAKRYGYKVIPNPEIFIFEGKIIGHPITIKKLLRRVTDESAI